MKFCPQCGTLLRDDAAFCSECGCKVAAQPAAEPAPAPAAPEAAAPAYTAPVEPAAPAAPVYTPPAAPAAPSVTVNVNTPNGKRPVGQLKTNRSLLKYILLGLVTLGIYDIVVMSTLTSDINIIAHRYDGKRTLHLFSAMVLTSVTLGIYGLVWNHKLCDRLRGELARRGIDYKISPGTFWGWGFFGALIIVGPFIYAHKLLKSMNLLCEPMRADFLRSAYPAVTPGYHMNKTHWNTVRVDDIDFDVLEDMIAESFELTAPRLRGKIK